MVTITNETAAREQEVRVTRAVSEGGEMVWTKTAAGWSVETASGGHYVVSRDGCTCPDHQYRCAGTSRRCKHVLALALYLVRKGLL